jgi:hypothetical protein
VTIVDKTAEPADVFAAHLARWEAAVADPDGTVERVARALHHDWHPEEDWDAIPDSVRGYYRRLAAAAIDALRPAPDAPRVDLSEFLFHGGSLDGQTLHVAHPGQPYRVVHPNAPDELYRHQSGNDYALDAAA